MQNVEQSYLVKFLVASTASFFVGSVHGVLQVVPRVRAWLDMIGSPYGGPGHMIDPLAHAHINLIGGVTVLAMAVTYYMLPRLTSRVLYSRALVEHSFWWTIIGTLSFYLVLMVFGIWEGHLLLAGSDKIEDVHAVAGPIIAVAATVMGIGIWLFLANVALSLRDYYRDRK